MQIHQTVHKAQPRPANSLKWLIPFFILTFLFDTNGMAQRKNQMVRLAKIKVDSLQLENYNAALTLQITTAVSKEPGVLTYYAVADKNDPTNITILEIYADTTAYNFHITTPHFKKYKETVKDWVKSLELVDVSMVGYAVQQKLKPNPDYTIIDSSGYLKGKKMANAGLGLLIGGASLSAMGVIVIAASFSSNNGGEAGGYMVLAGCVAMLPSIPLIIAGKNKIKKSRVKIAVTQTNVQPLPGVSKTLVSAGFSISL